MIIHAWMVGSATLGEGDAARTPPVSRLLPHGLTEAWTYDALTQSRLDRHQVGTAANPTALVNHTYTYDAQRNITRLVDDVASTTQQFGYDDRDRLTQWTLGSTVQAYAYDTLGNLTQKGTLALRYGSSTNRDGTGTGPHQVRQYQIGMALPVDLTYDVTGNLTNDGTTAYTWNTQLQPIQVSRSGFSEAYTYDADGTRVTRTTGGQTTVYLEGGMWEESTATTGTIRQTYTVNGQAIAVRTIADKSNATAVARITSLHGDHLGSVSVTSESGVQTGRQDFDPWGNIRGTSSVNATRRGFTGQYRDDSGLLFYNARYYHPFLSRFISADTIVPGSNPLTVAPLDALAQAAWQSSGSGAANPQDLNRYSYALNNPLRYTDPTGHWVVTVAYGGRIALGFGSVSGSAGLAIDGQSGATGFSTGGLGVAYGVGVGFGVTISIYPDFERVAQLEGLGTQVGIDAAGGGVDALGNGDRPVGISVSIPRTGPGSLTDVHGEYTYTLLATQNSEQRNTPPPFQTPPNGTGRGPTSAPKAVPRHVPPSRKTSPQNTSRPRNTPPRNPNSRPMPD